MRRSSLLLAFLFLASSAFGATGRGNCENHPGDPEAVLRADLDDIENAYLRLASDNSPLSSQNAHHCTEKIVALVIDDTVYDPELYYSLMRMIANEASTKRDVVVGLADLSYALQERYETVVLPRYYAQESARQELVRESTTLGFALGSAGWGFSRFGWSLPSVSMSFGSSFSALGPVRIEAPLLGGATATAMQAAPAVVPAVSLVITRKDRKAPPPPSVILDIASPIKEDRLSEVSALRQYWDVGGQLLGMTTSVGVMRLGARACAEISAEPGSFMSRSGLLIKGTCFLTSIALAHWADDVVRETASHVTDAGLRHSMETNLREEALALESAVNAKQEDASSALVATHRLLEAALQLSALRILLAVDARPSDDFTLSLAMARSYAQHEPEFDVSREVANFLARTAMIRELKKDGKPADGVGNPNTDPVAASRESELAAFRNQSRMSNLLEFLSEREGEDERELAQDLRNGIIHREGGELWLQVRAFMLSLHRKFFDLYIQNMIEPRISRGLVTSEILSFGGAP